MALKTKMSNTLYQAVSDYLAQHPDLPDGYFKVPHRAAKGYFNKKVYLTAKHQAWRLVELNFFHLFFHRLLSMMTLGFWQYYGQLSFKKMPLPQSAIDDKQPLDPKVYQVYQDLLASVFSTRHNEPNQPIKKVETPAQIKQAVVKLKRQLTAEPYSRQQTYAQQKPLLMNTLRYESAIAHPKQYQQMATHVQLAANTHYAQVFNSLDEMDDKQRTALVRLLDGDPKLSLGLWNGIMHHGKAFELSKRTEVKTWIPPILQALSDEQFAMACQDAKFWEVLGFCLDEVGSSLTIKQWARLVALKPESSLIAKLMVSLPVDNQLYDKLSAACGRVAIDYDTELSMEIMISNLSRYLKKHNDPRTVDELRVAIRNGPKKATPKKKRLSRHSQYIGKRWATVKDLNAPSAPDLNRSVSYENLSVILRPTEPQWQDRRFNEMTFDLKTNCKNDIQEEALFWELLCRFPAAKGADAKRCENTLRYLVHHHRATVFGQLDDMSTLEVKRLLAAIEQTDPSLIVNIWDALMKGASQLGYTLEQQAIANAEKVLTQVSSQLLASSVTDNKMWAVFRHYADIVGAGITKAQLTVLAPYIEDQTILAKIISDLPQDKQLGEKLAIICPYVAPNPQLELQLQAKIRWFQTNIDNNTGEQLKATLKAALEENSTEPNAFLERGQV